MNKHNSNRFCSVYPGYHYESLPGVLLVCVCISRLIIGSTSMSMGGIFPDTVASMVVMALLAGVHPCVGTAAPPHLTSYPEAATDGADLTLSCTPAQGRTLISVSWNRNNVYIFDTSSDDDASAAILHPLTISPEYQSVSGRISVNSSPQQHNVTLRTNSPLDQGSVWRCQSGQQFSNNLTIEVKESIQGTSRAEEASSPGPVSTRESTTLATEEQHTGPSSTDDKDMITTNQTTTSTQSPSSSHDKDMMTTKQTVSTKSPSSTDDKDMTTTNQTTTSTQTPFIETVGFIYVVAGSAGVVIVVVIVIVVLLCIRSRREGKCQTDDKTEKDNCEERGHNEESERETIVMEDNDLYHGFVGIKNQKSAEKQQVSDVYAKVNKVRKTHNATEVQITLGIEDMYAKPNKPASRKSEAASKVSSNQNADVNTPD
ncbi:uncharacterized protein LOC124113533 isoform X1 [Haliotis rufescens]|uniref:uncharacterized protein LOC124113533 isoform X1 n=1 Tax=Haliotis rufescens TaxID=6454 RepID=UPI00201F4638|nr:uncharacterized protein LOC124113533 isoform X1 [Haliotis rufescens]